ncbi:MAG: hypothetical protein ABI304_00375 [Rudaea sp.]
MDGVAGDILPSAMASRIIDSRIDWTGIEHMVLRRPWDGAANVSAQGMFGSPMDFLNENLATRVRVP